MSQKYIVGIDEVGRGPLAGPVSVGIVVVEQNFDFSTLGKFTDSKKMTERAREGVYERASKAQAHCALRFGVYSEPAEIIDAKGIVFALNSCITRGLRELIEKSEEALVCLDGSLKAPSEYTYKSIIRGDSLVPAISLASVVAKVERDRYMAGEAHTTYPLYGFDRHKGYGTALHQKAIQTHGLTPLHRRTFIY